MITILIVGGIIAAAVVILGAYLRWAVLPVLVGYEAGVSVGRLLAARAEREAQS